MSLTDIEAVSTCSRKASVISEVDGALAVYVAFEDEDVKARVERFLSSITNSIEMVLRRNVEVRIILVTDGLDSVIYSNQSDIKEGHRQTEATLVTERGGKANCSVAVTGYSDLESQEEPAKLYRGSFNGANAGEKQEMPVQGIESIICEQRLETAWLQVAEKGTPGSLSRLKPEKNQVLPQEDTYQQNQMDSIDSAILPSQKWEDESNHELKVLKMQDRRVLHEDHRGYPISPSLLHGSIYVGNGDKETLDMNHVRLVEEVAVDFSAGTTEADVIGQRPKGLQLDLEAERGDFHCLVSVQSERNLRAEIQDNWNISNTMNAWSKEKLFGTSHISLYLFFFLVSSHSQECNHRKDLQCKGFALARGVSLAPAIFTVRIKETWDDLSWFLGY